MQLRLYEIERDINEVLEIRKRLLCSRENDTYKYRVVSGKRTLIYGGTSLLRMPSGRLLFSSSGDNSGSSIAQNLEYVTIKGARPPITRLGVDIYIYQAR